MRELFSAADCKRDYPRIGPVALARVSDSGAEKRTWVRPSLVAIICLVPEKMSGQLPDLGLLLPPEKTRHNLKD
ncbi:MAG: hypothetical protein KGM95_01080 [Betaproteobacteria bacterium]|nr:hypothetical protein [Betaproteobacteria bacterium]